MRERHEEILQTLPVAVCSADARTGRVLFVGGPTQQICGYAPEELRRDSRLGRRILHPDDKARVLAAMKAGAKSGRAFHLDLRIRHREGREVRLRASVAPVLNARGKIARYTCTFTELAGLESASDAGPRRRSASDAHLEQIRKLTLDAARCIEEERAQISRELHDQLGQMLTAINLNLAWLTSHSQGWGKPARERLRETTQFLNQLLETVRTLSVSLRPPTLDGRDLLDAIRSYAGKFARRAGFSCRVVANPSDLRIPEPLATTVLRIIQESLTNIARHSRASRCGIFLKRSDSFLQLNVRDNGVGAVPSRFEGVQSLGIAGMRERAEAVGGNLRVRNESEGGVCVTARLPWQHLETGRT